jgi:hypothetical protein
VIEHLCERLTSSLPFSPFFSYHPGGCSATLAPAQPSDCSFLFDLRSFDIRETSSLLQICAYSLDSHFAHRSFLGWFNILSLHWPGAHMGLKSSRSHLDLPIVNYVCILWDGISARSESLGRVGASTLAQGLSHEGKLELKNFVTYSTTHSTFSFQVWARRSSLHFPSSLSSTAT